MGSQQGYGPFPAPLANFQSEDRGNPRTSRQKRSMRPRRRPDSDPESSIPAPEPRRPPPPASTLEALSPPHALLPIHSARFVSVARNTPARLENSCQLCFDRSASLRTLNSVCPTYFFMFFCLTYGNFSCIVSEELSAGSDRSLQYPRLPPDLARHASLFASTTFLHGTPGYKLRPSPTDHHPINLFNFNHFCTLAFISIPLACR
jgi:hypothetical protein